MKKTRKRTPLMQRLLSRMEIDLESGCWLWQGYLDRNGYGQISDPDRGVQYVHRAAYEELVGPIQNELDHVRARGCVHTNCCNPDHLEDVTRQENVARAPLAITAAVLAATTHCPQGHEYTAENTRVYRGSRYCKECQRASARERKRRARRARGAPERRRRAA